MNLRSMWRQFRGPSRLVMLVSDFDWEDRPDGYALTILGIEQLTACVQHIQSLSQTSPELWLATNWNFFGPTADVLRARLTSEYGAEITYRDRGVEGYRSAVRFDYRRNRFGLKLIGPSEAPVVMIVHYAHAQVLLQAAGANIGHSRHVRTRRAYPILVDPRGRMTLSSLLDYENDVPEFLTDPPRYERYPRD